MLGSGRVRAHLYSYPKQISNTYFSFNTWEG